MSMKRECLFYVSSRQWIDLRKEMKPLIFIRIINTFYKFYIRNGNNTKLNHINDDILSVPGILLK